MIASSSPPAYTVPDFEADREGQKRYDDALQRRRRLELVEAEGAIRRGFTRRAETLTREIKALERNISAGSARVRSALDRYRRQCPRRVLDNKPARPSFWENLLSFGYANMLYSVAIIAIDYLDETVARWRETRRALDGLEAEKTEALETAKRTIEERLATHDWLAAFEARPEIAPLARGVKAIKAERAAFANRLVADEVSHEELRDRTFAERAIAPIVLPLDAMLVYDYVEFGPLGYYVLRDLNGKLSRLPYDPRLEPLVDAVVDVYRIGDDVTASLHRRDDRRPAIATDHFTESGATWDEARLAVEKRRGRLDGVRPDAAAEVVLDEIERAVIDALLYFIRHGAIVAKPR